MSQNTFTTALFDAQAPLPEGLSDGQGRKAGKRFDVYRNNVAVSLTEALLSAFPVITKLVGEDFFRALAGVFLRQHPPSSPVMMFYGAEMPAFLTDFAPVAALPYLRDVARVEQAVRQAYHAVDVQAVLPEDLEGMAPEAVMGLTFTLAPAVHIIRSPHPVGAIWQANMIDGPKPQTCPEDVVVSRPEFDPEVDILGAGQAGFLEALGRGLPLGEAAETSLAATPDFDLSAALGLCLMRGLLCLTPSL